MKPQVGDLLRDAPVPLAAERRRDYLGRLLANLAADGGLARRQQPGDVRSRRPARFPLLDGSLELLEHASRRGPRAAAGGAAFERREEARPLPRVAGDALLVDQHEQRVPVTVGVERLDVLDVPGRLALRPRLAARARPEVGHAARQRRFHGRSVHPGNHEELAGVGLLDHGGDQALGIEPELVERHGSLRISTPRLRR